MNTGFSKSTASAARRSREARTAELVQQLRQAPASERQALRDRLVEVNMPIASMLAARYAGRGLETADLEQVAYLGLMAAARRFDPERGDEFLAFAIPTVTGEVRKAFRNLGWAVRPPRRLQELQAKIRGVRGLLEQELQRTPEAAEIAARLGVDTEDVIEAISIDGCFSPHSLDLPTGDDEVTTLGDRQGYDEIGFERAELDTVLAPAFRKLGPRDRLIVRMRFYEGRTQSEIGERIGVTQMQVSRLLKRILDELRSELIGTAA